MPFKHNPRHISWDSCDVFCPPNVGFCDWVSQKPEIQHWEGRNTAFCRNIVAASGVPAQLDEDCSCEGDINGYKATLFFHDIDNEVELILARVSTFSSPRNIDHMTICPVHLSSLGSG